MPKPPPVSLRVKVPLDVYERISAYRHEARHESRAQALTALLAAGLAALSRPPQLPAGSASNGKASETDLTSAPLGAQVQNPAPRVRPSRAKQSHLVSFAGAEEDGRSQRQ